MNNCKVSKVNLENFKEMKEMKGELQIHEWIQIIESESVVSSHNIFKISQIS